MKATNKASETVVSLNYTQPQPQVKKCKISMPSLQSGTELENKINKWNTTKEMTIVTIHKK